MEGVQHVTRPAQQNTGKATNLNLAKPISKRRNEVSQGQVAILRSMVVELRGIVEKQTEAIQDLKVEQAKFKEQSQGWQVANEQTVTQCRAIKKLVEGVKNSAENMTNQKEMLAKQFEDLRAEVTKLREENDTLRNEFQQQVTELREENTTHRTKLQQLKTQPTWATGAARNGASTASQEHQSVPIQNRQSDAASPPTINLDLSAVNNQPFDKPNIKKVMG